MRKSLLIFTVAVGVSLIPTMLVAAQEPTLYDAGSSYSADAQAGRLQKLKEEYRIKLTDKEKERVIERCTLAQENLQKISNRLIETKKTRKASYTTVVTALSALRGLASSKEIDTSNIELLIVDYQQKIQLFDSAVASYEIALEDAIKVDCKTQPEEFRAALEGVRADRKSVATASAQIDETTKSNLKTALDTLKTRLESVENVNGK